jgi:hypothetical protein
MPTLERLYFDGRPGHEAFLPRLDATPAGLRRAPADERALDALTRAAGSQG